ncbi:MAG: glycoside hydrolase family 55 protein [Planctomycetes bacterium]|nr:glycoside hydrolase family 55 protein [Planctomycetota bacterium]
MPSAPRGVFTNPTTVWSAAGLLNNDGGQSLRVSYDLPWYRTSDYANMAALVAAAGAGPYNVIVNAHIHVTANLTLGAGIHLVYQPNYDIEVDTGITFTVNSPQHVHCPIRERAFTLTGTGVVRFTGGGQLYPGWWGAVGDGATDDKPAIQAMFQAGHNGDTFYFPPARYAIADTVNIGVWSIDGGTGDVLGWAYTLQGIQVIGGQDPKSAVPTACIFWTGGNQPGTTVVTLSDSHGNYNVITDAKPMFAFLACSNLTMRGMVFDGDGDAFAGVQFDGNYSYVDLTQCDFRECYVGIRNTRHYNLLTWAAAWDYTAAPSFVAHVYDAPSVGGYQSDSHHYTACQFLQNTIGYTVESQQALALEFHQCGFSGNTTAHVVNNGGRMDFYGCWSGGTPTNEFLHVTSTCWLSFHEFHSESVPTNAGFQSSTTAGANPRISLVHSEFKDIYISSGGAEIASLNSSLCGIYRLVDAAQDFAASVVGGNLSQINLCATASPTQIRIAVHNAKVDSGTLMQGAGAADAYIDVQNIMPVTAYTGSTALLGTLALPASALVTIGGTDILTAARLDAKASLLNAVYGIVTPANVKALWVLDATGAVQTITDRSTIGGATAHTVTLRDASFAAINASTCSPGIVGMAPYLTFDATHLFDTPDSADFSFAAAPFSVLVLEAPAAASGMLLAKWDNTGTPPANAEWKLELAANKLYVTLLDGDDGSYIERYYNTSLAGDIGAQHTYGFTHDGGALAAGIKIYRDGVQIDDTSSISGTFVAMNDGTAAVGNYTSVIAGVKILYNAPAAATSVALIVAEELTALQLRRLDAILRGFANVSI